MVYLMVHLEDRFIGRGRSKDTIGKVVVAVLAPWIFVHTHMEWLL
jgi:hypothetical protein